MNWGSKLLNSLFFVLMAIEFFGPRYAYEILVDLIVVLSFSVFLFFMTQRRCVTATIKWVRYFLWALSLFYLAFMALYLANDFDRVFRVPSDAWRALTHSWFVFSALVLCLSLPSFVRFFSKLQSNPARFILVVYSGVALFASLLLVLPISLKPGLELTNLDAFFTTVSAISGTGLVVTNTAETFSLFGQFVILIVMQAGGVGIITFSGILLLLIGREIGLGEKVIQDSTERLHFTGSLKSFTAIVATVMLVVEGIAALCLLPWTLQITEGHWGMAIFHAIFQSVSAFCTAGFTSLPMGMETADGAFLPLSVIAITAVLGMLGLPSIYAIYRFLKSKRVGEKLSSYAKLEIIIAISVLAFGTLSLFVVEFTNPVIYSGMADQLLHSFFQSAMRNAGFNSIVIADMSLPAIFILMSLMIVGGASMSTAGGIKTSTLGMMIIFVVSFLKGLPDATFDRRRIPVSFFLKAATLISLFFAVLFFGFVGLALSQPHIGPLELLFETISALSVTGFSLGATPDLNPIGKFIVISLMLIGRIGLLTGVYALIRRRKPSSARYPKGEFYVG